MRNENESARAAVMRPETRTVGLALVAMSLPSVGGEPPSGGPTLHTEGRSKTAPLPVHARTVIVLSTAMSFWIFWKTTLTSSSVSVRSCERNDSEKAKLFFPSGRPAPV